MWNAWCVEILLVCSWLHLVLQPNKKLNLTSIEKLRYDNQERVKPQFDQTWAFSTLPLKELRKIKNMLKQY